MRAISSLFLLVFLLSACGESGQEHFCSKYQYLHNQLSEPDVLPFPILKRQLRDELNDENKREDAKMALFVISGMERGQQRANETPRDYCLRAKRWEHYR